MNYLNKFGNYVSKGISGLQNQFGNNKKNEYVDRGVNSFEDIEKPPQNEEFYFGSSSGSSQPKNNFFSNFQQPQQPQQPQQQFMMQPQQQPQQFYSPQPQQMGENKPNSSSSLSAFLLGASTTESKKKREMDKEFIKDFEMIRGEMTVNWENCEIKIDNIDFPCKAMLTNYRLYLIPNFQNLKEKYSTIFPKNYFRIPIHHIQNLDQVKERTKNFKVPISINLKDQRVILILFRVGQGMAFISNLVELVNSLSKIAYLDFAKKYNFDYHPKEDGWLLYNAPEEYARQGLSNLQSNTHFRETTMNANFCLCETYPKYLICPKEISDEDYRRASEFRTKQRVPTLSYFYYKSKGSIWRSSQVKGGIMSNRNVYDEKLINAITLISEKKKIAVYDCRPYLSAYANKLKGAGPESVDNYHAADIVFCNIDNIHVARNSLKAVFTYLNTDAFNEDKNFMSKFDGSKWTEFIFLLIKKSIAAAKSVRDGLSVLIHCSDGWDRASQMTAFTQLFVDPYFRTLKGYMVLIEKDFLSFGHQFKSRNGYYDPKGSKENQVSPILLQFLDATSQVLVQYPMYFEFNMNFLVFVANHINSGKYGTFLFNNEKERDVMKAKIYYCSIWSDVLENKSAFINELYDSKTKDSYCFTPNFSPHQIRFWSEYFLQNCQLNFTYNYADLININNLKKQNQIFEDEVANFNTLSNYRLYTNQLIQTKKDLRKAESDKKSLRSALYELMKVGIINDDVIENCSQDTKNLINKLKSEKNKMANIFDFFNKKPNNSNTAPMNNPVGVVENIQNDSVQEVIQQDIPISQETLQEIPQEITQEITQETVQEAVEEIQNVQQTQDDNIEEKIDG